MNTINKTLSSWLKLHLEPHTHLLIAYSGGRDSHVLLDALVKLGNIYSFNLSAIHVNHGLQQISDSWVGHCQTVCDAYGVPLKTLNLKLKILPGESLEDKARNARYKAFAEYMSDKSILLTAHTQDDQAETFLLQMMRGSGIKGLGGIGASKSFASGCLARPLLTVSRAEIAHYASENNLKWIEDPSNENIALRRNYVRKHILGPLEAVQANTSRCIARSAQHCHFAYSLLEEYLSADLALCLGEDPLTLKADVLKQFSDEKQNFILGLWLSQNHIKSPPKKKRDEILRQFLCAAQDSNPVIAWGEWQLKRYQNLIYVLRQPPEITKNQTWLWNMQEPLTLQVGATWQVRKVRGAGASLSKLQQKTIYVAYRQGGERCLLDKQTNSKSLKKLLQEMKMPPWQRNSLPLFYSDNSLIAVADLFISKDWLVEHPDEEGVCFEKLES